MNNNMRLTFDDWLRLQYGPGRRYNSARALSIAYSDGHNHNSVAEMHSRGVPRVENLLHLARICQADPVFLMCLVAGVDMEVPGGRVGSDAEARLLRAYRQLDQMAQRLVILGCEGAAYESAESPETSRFD